jgi:hypothetical protein
MPTIILPRSEGVPKEEEDLKQLLLLATILQGLSYVSWSTWWWIFWFLEGRGGIIVADFL